ncbi:MAG: hypothetical protein ACE5EV_05775 [Gaiellales bacterium]
MAGVLRRLEELPVAIRIMVIGGVGGMIAGMMMAMVEMLYGAFNSTRSFWDSGMAIWSWVFGAEHFTQNDPGAHVGPVILGIGAHMANSMMFGIMFAALMYMFRPRGFMAPMMVGMAMSLGAWAIMRYGILPLNAGEDDLFTKDIVSPQWVWWVAHGVMGMFAAMYYLAVRPYLVAGSDAKVSPSSGDRALQPTGS